MQLKKNVFFFAILTTLVSLSSCSKTDDPIDTAVKTPGSLAVKATTSSYKGDYAPTNIVAIWVESSSGTFVKTLMANAAIRKQYLTNWLKASSNGNTTDAVTGATLTTHMSHTVSWNGKNVSGAIVDDGAYTLCVEFTEDNATGKLAKFAFTKGIGTQTLNPAAQSDVSNVTLTWTPTGK